jgi:transcriptional regulator with XRE-family HTH domain
MSVKVIVFFIMIDSKTKATVKSGFGKRLRELRRQKNMTQIQLAKRVGITHTHIGRYELGTANKPSADTIKRIAEALGVSSDYLLEGASDQAVKVHIEDQELLQQFKEIEKMPEDDKTVVKKFLDAFITKKKIQELTAR